MASAGRKKKRCYAEDSEDFEESTRQNSMNSFYSGLFLFIIIANLILSSIITQSIFYSLKNRTLFMKPESLWMIWSPLLRLQVRLPFHFELSIYDYFEKMQTAYAEKLPAHSNLSKLGSSLSMSLQLGSVSTCCLPAPQFFLRPVIAHIEDP
mmetsp:Transcript_30523/g.73685  ORF Transcript_30523/g.73685 Transcript_30523/m.73685 type:complete len:152 (+) Transcript_30523:1065-1520(+)